jgi:hypothetical protein
MIVACVSCHVQKEKSDIRDVKQYSLSSLRFDAKSRGTMLRDDYEQIALQIGSKEIGCQVRRTCVVSVAVLQERREEARRDKCVVMKEIELFYFSGTRSTSYVVLVLKGRHL